jgi:aldose 1-epimerase
MSGPLEVVRLGDDALTVEVLPGVGARLHRVRAFGIDLLRTPDDPARHLDDPWFWGSYPLAPWCNRLATGLVEVAGRTIDLPPNFPDGTAIHGQVARAAWRRDGDGTFRIRAGGDGWPWPYDVRQTLEVDGDPAGPRLRLTLVVTNLGDSAMPAGLGIHPWFRDPVEVAIAARLVHPSNEDASPEPEPVGGDLDRRTLGPLAVGVDATWTGLADPPVILRWPADQLRATISTSATARYVVAAHLDGVDATAVEPETHAPGGIRRLLAGEPGALQLIEPGAPFELRVDLAIVRET